MCKAFNENINTEVGTMHLWYKCENDIFKIVSFSRDMGIPFDKQDTIFRSYLNESAYHILSSAKRILAKNDDISLADPYPVLYEWINYSNHYVTKENSKASTTTLLYPLSDCNIEVDGENNKVDSGDAIIFKAGSEYKILSSDLNILKIEINSSLAFFKE